MRVRVDEPRRDDLPGRIDARLARRVAEPTGQGSGATGIDGFADGSSIVTGCVARTTQEVITFGKGDPGQTGLKPFFSDRVFHARYNADGTLDPTFGDGGKVITDFSGLFDSIWDLAIQSDGKYVAAGQTERIVRVIEDPECGCPVSIARIDLAIARYNIDGSLDSGFGSDGKIAIQVTDPATDRPSTAQSVAIQRDGKIVAAGTGDGFGVVRLNEDGSVLIIARRHRTQDQNRRDAFERLADLVRHASVEPKTRHATKPTRASKERRLEHKKVRKKTKSLRGRVSWD